MNSPLDLTVMMYHYVRDQGDEAEAGSGIPGMSVHAFEEQLDHLSRQYAFVTWSDVYAAIQDNRSLPQSACLLTFDDGVCDHYLNAFRVLRERNLSGLFFVLDRSQDDGLILAHKIHFLLAKLSLPGLRQAIWDRLDPARRIRFTQAENRYRLRYAHSTLDSQMSVFKAVLQREFSKEIDPLLSDLFERHVGSETETARRYYLNPDRIQEMRARGMHFGGHSRNHPWFDWIDADARAAEIQDSADWLQPLQPGPLAFAYPYGGLAEDSPELLKKHGFVAAFTTKEQLLHPDPYYIGRLDGEEFAQNGNRYA